MARLATQGARVATGDGDGLVTTTIRSQMIQVKRLLEGHREQESEALRIGRAKQRSQKLENAVTRLERYWTSLQAMTKAGVDLDLPSLPDGLGGLIAGELERANADDLAAAEGDEPRAIGEVDGYGRTLESVVKEAWNQLRESANPPPALDDEELDIVEDDEPGIRARVERLRMHLTPLRYTDSPGEGDVESWNRMVADLNQIADAVAARSPSPDVAEFRRLARQPGGAPLELLESPAVQDYLAEPGRKKRYRVRMR